MSPSIDISETHKEIVQAILREHLTNTCHVWVFGSRATWLAKEHSDLDLAIARKDGTALSLTVMSAIETAFEDSLLPWKVDVIDLNSVSEEFSAAIERDKVLFSLGVGGEWKKVQLRDIVTLLGDGLHGTPKYDNKGQYYFINGNNLENGKIVFRDTTKKVNHSEFLKYKKDLGNKTLLVSINGTIGNVAYYNGENVILGKSACYFNIIDNIEKRYIRYVLSGHPFLSYLEAFATGTTIKNISLKSMREFPFLLPPLPEQKAIAHILGTLDDKIELNRQTNQTLEAMAQALFQSWFVDFDPVIDKALAAGNEIPEAFQAKAAARQALGDQRQALPEEVTALFPDAFVFTEEMGWVPEGWEVNPLAEIIEIIGGGTPKTSIKEYWDGDIPWFSVVDAPNSSDIFVIDTEKHITATGLENSSTRLLNKGTTIISARGTVGKCAMVGKPMAMNQSCYGIHGKKDISNTYIYYSVLLSVSDLQRKSHGSVFGTITRDTFKLIQIPFCGEALTQLFDHYIEPSFEKVLSNCNKNISLTTLRDTLLPKLISGELRVADAGGFLGEVGV